MLEQSGIHAVGASDIEDTDRLLAPPPQCGDKLFEHRLGGSRYLVIQPFQFAKISPRVELVVDVIHVGFGFVYFIEAAIAGHCSPPHPRCQRGPPTAFAERGV